MREHLVFLLSGPMASFGGYAGHERRGSGLVPMRSAVLGLVGAALGIVRGDTEGQAALRAYSVAVQLLQQSVPLRDYHTVQTVPTARAKRPPTRGRALERAGRDINTMITIRDYRCDVLVGVALWGDGPWPLDLVAERLRRPEFPLYLGRKSCPLASPLNPSLVMATGPVEALARIEIPEWLRPEWWSEQERGRYLVYSDPVDGFDRPPSTEQMPSEPIDRQAWTFEERTVWHLGGHGSEHGDQA
ncbi:MAG: type I-E CRISPR-associated protein Cas5/CasD [Boseongicola sp. SB0664_bin_43]|uniref:Type I-E CRISPR-associated protein Cas5/CasD n=1 Tax=Boseongicola sp. SB0664_bin_43 TaxID=2604844 RepID=A0A6B0Y3X5_9RHOB|nr:type I-E CRISPR-associated protein Cas5/CasD [Boseongicola sp. SB0664_bin_43]